MSEMLTQILFNIFGVFAFLYIFWKKLKEDYFPALIFNTAFYMLFGILIGFIISAVFASNWWFWLTFIGASFGLYLGIARLRLRVYEVIEAATIALLPWITLIFLADAAATARLESFLAGVVSIFLLLFYAFLNNHYKNFAWYISGRVGFSGLTTLTVFFLIRASLAILFPTVLSFVNIEVFLSGILSFFLILVIYKLARKKV